MNSDIYWIDIERFINSLLVLRDAGYHGIILIFSKIKIKNYQAKCPIFYYGYQINQFIIDIIKIMSFPCNIICKLR